jgi:hypothetical protein
MRASVLSICFMLVFGMVLQAQEFSEKSYLNQDRKWLVEIPLWVPGFRGNLSYGDVTFDSSGSSEEKERERLSSSLGIEFYFVGRIRFTHKRFHLMADAFGGKINSVFTVDILNEERQFAEIAIQGIFPRFIAGYSILRFTDDNKYRIELIPYAGVRYVDFYLDSKIFASTIDINVNPGYFQPVLGVYVPIDYQRWRLESQVDYGALENNSSWVLSTSLRYRISKLIDLKLGYNHMNFMYKKQIAENQLKIDIRLSGPSLGIGFIF